MAGLKFDITGDNGNMLSALHGVQNGVKQTQKIVEQSGINIEQTFNKAKTSVSAMGSSIAEATEATSRYAEALKKDVEVQNMAKQSSKELKESLKMYEDAIKDIQKSINDGDYDSKIKKATVSIDKQKEKIDNYKMALSKLSKEDNSTGGGANYYNNLINKAKEKVDNLTISVGQWKKEQETLNADMERYTMLAGAAHEKLNGQSMQVSSVDNSTQKQSLSELNISLSDSKSKLQQLESELEKFKNIPLLTDSQKAKIIDLNAEIEKTKEKIKSLEEQIRAQRSDTFFGSMRNAVDVFGNKISETKEKVKNFISEHTKLNDIKDKIGNNPGIQRFKAEYTQAKGVVSDFGQKVENLLTGNGKLQQSFGAMGTAINGMGLPLKGVGSGIANVTKALWAMCATPVGAVITVIVMGLASMYKYLTKSAEGQKALAQISAYLGSLLSSITDIVVILGKFLFHAFTDANGPMKAFAKGMTTTFTTAIKTVGELVGGLGTALKGIFKMDWNAFSDGMGKIWKGIKDGGKTALSAIDTAFKGAIGSVKLVYSGITDNNLGKDLGGAFDGIINKATKSAELAKRTTEATIAAGKAKEQAAKLDIQIAENREKIYKLTGKAKDALIEETKILQKRRYDSILDAQKKDLDIQREKIRLHTASLEDLAKERQLRIDVLRTTAEQASSTRMLTRMQESNRRKMESVTKQTAKKEISSSNAIGAANARFDEVNYTNANEREKAITELEKKLLHIQISAIKDSAERVSAEREQQNKDELSELENQRKNIIEAERKRQKAEFDASQAIVKARGGKITVWSEGMFNDQTEDVKQINDLFDSLKEESIKKIIRENIEEQRNGFNTYLKEYGTFEEKKLAIAQEYEDKISKANSIGEKASLEMQRDKEIEKAKNEDLQNTIDWNGVFSDLQGHTKKYLQGLRYQLQELLNTGNLPIDQMQTVSEKINAIDDELGKQQGIWDFVGERTREHNRLLKEAADAQERLNVAKKEEENANSNLTSIKLDAQKGLSNAGLDLKIENITTSSLNGKIDLTNEKYKGMSAILQKLAIAEGKLTEARRKTADATNKARQKEDAAKRKPAQEIADWFSDAQDFIKSKGIDQLPDLLSSVGLGGIGDKVGKGLDGFNSAAGAAADFASGNYIGAALKGISAITSFGSVLGIGGGNEKEVAETTERLTKSNEILKASIDDLKNSIEKSNGSKAVDSYRRAVDNQKQVIENTMDILKSQMYYHSAHHSNVYYWDLNKSDYADINSTLAKFAKDNPTAETKRNSVNSINDIFQLTPEQMKVISTEQVKIWQKMLEAGKYDKSEYWKNYIELAGQLEELTEKINNNLTQTSFDGLHDDFVSTIMDMDATASDFANNFTKMMAKAWTNAAVGNMMDDKLKKFYAKWSKKMQSRDADNNEANFSKYEIDEMRAEYQKLVDQALSLRNTMSQITGYGSQLSKQNATANGASSITYEQSTSLIALITAGNISRDQIKDIFSTIMASAGTLTAFSSSTNSAVLEIKNLMIYSNSHLEDILKYTKSIYSEFSDKIDSVNKNLMEIR